MLKYCMTLKQYIEARKKMERLTLWLRCLGYVQTHLSTDCFRYVLVPVYSYSVSGSPSSGKNKTKQNNLSFLWIQFCWNVNKATLLPGSRRPMLGQPDSFPRNVSFPNHMKILKFIHSSRNILKSFYLDL